MKFFLMAGFATGNTRSWALGRREYGIFRTGGRSWCNTWFSLDKICYLVFGRCQWRKHLQAKSRDVWIFSLWIEFWIWLQHPQNPTRQNTHKLISQRQLPLTPPRDWDRWDHGLWGLWEHSSDAISRRKTPTIAKIWSKFHGLTQIFDNNFETLEDNSNLKQNWTREIVSLHFWIISFWTV